MKTRLSVLGGLALMGLLAGCDTVPGPYLPQDTDKFTLENTEKFVLLDRATQHSVTCTGLQEQVLGDGRLEVVANVKNRERRRIEVQISCVFKNGQAFSAGDETPYETLILAENETKAVHFVAMNDKARAYTIRVRQTR